jgi:hypothetical protein
MQIFSRRSSRFIQILAEFSLSKLSIKKNANDMPKKTYFFQGEENLLCQLLSASELFTFLSLSFTFFLL